MPSIGVAAGIRNKGAYAAGTAYIPDDMVTFNNSLYIATANTTGNAPTVTSFWQPLIVGAVAAGIATEMKWGTD